MKVKEVKLVFKDENKKDLISDTILIKEGMNWLMIEKLLVEFFEKHTGKKGYCISRYYHQSMDDR